MTSIVAYLRCSTDEQAEASIPRQRDAITAFAKRESLTIAKEYIDEGISGDRTEKRLAFHRLMDDCRTGKIRSIVVFDSHRFGRFDSLESGFWLHPLRQRGVKIISVTEGAIDYSDFGARIVAAVRAESGHDYLRKLGANATTGMARIAKQGKWAGGKAPFGFRRSPEGFLILGPCDEQQLVVHAFDLYAKGYSTRAIALEFTKAGYRTPRGKKWTQQTIFSWLNCPAYVGDIAWNRRSMSKYQSLRSEQLAAPLVKVNRKGEPTGWKKHDEADWVVVRDAHPPIIGRKVFDTVQRRLKENKKRTSPHRGPANPFLLTSLMRCGKCGASMVGERAGGITRYVCTGFSCYGTCDRNTAPELQVIEVIGDTIQKQFLTPSVIDKVKAKLAKRLKDRRPKVNDIQKELAKVDRQLEASAKRLLEIDRDLLDVVQTQVRELRQRRDDLRDAAVAAKAVESKGDRDIGRQVNQAIQNLRGLVDVLKSSDKAAARELLRSMIERIDVFSRRKKVNVRSRYQLEKMVFHWRLSGLSTIVGLFGQEAVKPATVQIDAQKV